MSVAFYIPILSGGKTNKFEGQYAFTDNVPRL